jgi:hypothetical protein
MKTIGQEHPLFGAMAETAEVSYIHVTLCKGGKEFIITTFIAKYVKGHSYIMNCECTELYQMCLKNKSSLVTSYKVRRIITYAKQIFQEYTPCH